MTADGLPAPEHDLALLLRDLSPQLRDGEWVFVTAARPPDGVEPLASFAEDEGLSSPTTPLSLSGSAPHTAGHFSTVRRR